MMRMKVSNARMVHFAGIACVYLPESLQACTAMGRQGVRTKDTFYIKSDLPLDQNLPAKLYALKEHPGSAVRHMVMYPSLLL
jgi:hypothetical protein